MGPVYYSLLKWDKGKKGYPTQAQIHLTNFCNLKCFFCPTRALVKNLDRKNELSTEEWLRIIDEGNEMGIEEWHICGGGEPLFFKDAAMVVIEKIKTSGRRGELITNGTIFDEQSIRKLVGLKWDKIFFSLDSPLAQTQNELRGADCFDKIIGNVKLFTKIKKERNSSFPVLCFHMVICNKNYKQVPDMVKLANDLGLQEVLLNALNIWRPEINSLKLTEEQEAELIAIVKESKKLAEELNVGNNFDEFLKSELFKKVNVMDDAMKKKVRKTSSNELLNIPCYYPWYNISIFADGMVQPCFIPQGKGERIKGKTLKSIWFGECFSKIRESMKNGKLSKYCARCNPWNFEKMEEIRNELNSMLDV